jgi:hypothetical protein
MQVSAPIRERLGNVISVKQTGVHYTSSIIRLSRCFTEGLPMTCSNATAANLRIISSAPYAPSNYMLPSHFQALIADLFLN